MVFLHAKSQLRSSFFPPSNSFDFIDQNCDRLREALANKLLYKPVRSVEPSLSKGLSGERAQSNALKNQAKIYKVKSNV